MNFYKNNENIYSKFVECGCSVNAITNHYGSIYYGVATYNFERVLELMLELLLRKTEFTNTQYENELRIVESEIEMFGENKPSRKTCEFYKRNFGSEQYLFPIVGDKSILDMKSEQMVKEGFQKFYVPERTWLYIGGNQVMINNIEQVVNEYIDIKSYDR